MITKTVQINGYSVDLYCVNDSALPHGFEATDADTTSEEGYFRTGGLVWEGRELVDYDGVYELPKCVAAALANLYGDTISYAEFIL